MSLRTQMKPWQTTSCVAVQSSGWAVVIGPVWMTSRWLGDASAQVTCLRSRRWCGQMECTTARCVLPASQTTCVALQYLAAVFSVTECHRNNVCRLELCQEAAFHHVYTNESPSSEAVTQSHAVS